MKNFLKGIETMAAKRMAVCRTCEHFEPRLKRCQKCGCFTVGKTRMPHAHCPVGKWPREVR